MKFKNLLPKARVVWILVKMAGFVFRIKEIQQATPRIEEALDALKKEADHAER